MTHKTNYTAATLCVTLLLACASSAAHAMQDTTGKTSPDAYVLKNKPDKNTRERLFRIYETKRERCQHYVAPPEGYVYHGCDIVMKNAPVNTTAMYKVKETRNSTRLLPSVANYKIYFDFDKDNVRTDGQDVLDRAAREINTYNPVDVTVTGHADASGTADYNQDLSKRRADKVVAALQRLGIPSRILDEEARGESDLAVETPDGVRHPLNRRVTVDFRR